MRRNDEAHDRGGFVLGHRQRDAIDADARVAMPQSIARLSVEPSHHLAGTVREIAFHLGAVDARRHGDAICIGVERFPVERR